MKAEERTTKSSLYYIQKKSIELQYKYILLGERLKMGENGR